MNGVVRAAEGSVVPKALDHRRGVHDEAPETEAFGQVGCPCRLTLCFAPGGLLFVWGLAGVEPACDSRMIWVPLARLCSRGCRSRVVWAGLNHSRQQRLAVSGPCFSIAPARAFFRVASRCHVVAVRMSISDAVGSIVVPRGQPLRDRDIKRTWVRSDAGSGQGFITRCKYCHDPIYMHLGDDGRYRPFESWVAGNANDGQWAFHDCVGSGRSSGRDPNHVDLPPMKEKNPNTRTTRRCEHCGIKIRIKNYKKHIRKCPVARAKRATAE